MDKLGPIIATIITLAILAAVTTIIVVAQLITYGPYRTDCPREETLGELQGRRVCIPLLALQELTLEPEDVGLPGD